MRKGVATAVAGMMAALLIVSGAGLMVGAADSEAISNENKYALLIGSYGLGYLEEWENKGHGIVNVTGGEYTKPMVAGYGEQPYFEDVPFATRDLLVNEYGWLDENIMILFEEEATKQNIMAGLNWLLGLDAPGNMLLVEWEMHGSFCVQEDVQANAWFGADPDDELGMDEMAMTYNADPYTMENWVFDDELRYLFGGDDLEGTWVWLFGNCYSEGIGDDFKGENKIILCACSEHEATITSDPETGMHLFEYYVLSALAGETGENIWYCDMIMDPDANGDGAISLEEAFVWTQAAQENTAFEIFGYAKAVTHPVMFDGVDTETYL